MTNGWCHEQWLHAAAGKDDEALANRVRDNDLWARMAAQIVASRKAP